MKLDLHINPAYILVGLLAGLLVLSICFRLVAPTLVEIQKPTIQECLEMMMFSQGDAISGEGV